MEALRAGRFAQMMSGACGRPRGSGYLRGAARFESGDRTRVEVEGLVRPGGDVLWKPRDCRISGVVLFMRFGSGTTRAWTRDSISCTPMAA